MCTRIVEMWVLSLPLSTCDTSHWLAQLFLDPSHFGAPIPPKSGLRTPRYHYFMLASHQFKLKCTSFRHRLALCTKHR